MSVGEAAAATGWSAWTIRDLARRGEIAGTRDGRDWDLVEASLREYRQRRRELGANAPMRALLEQGVAA